MKRLLKFILRWLWAQIIEFIASVWRAVVAALVVLTVAYLFLSWKELI